MARYSIILLSLSLVGCIGSESARAEVLELETRAAQLHTRQVEVENKLARTQALLNATKKECSRPRLTVEAPVVIVKQVGEDL